VELALYRITLEALTNVVRHAHARRCMVKVDYAIDPDDARRRLTLTITDDGCGIAPQAAGGVGLRSMRERADEIGGVFMVQAQPGGGTRVQVTVPIDG
jgi:signal transduction histidine kinase